MSNIVNLVGKRHVFMESFRAAALPLAQMRTYRRGAMILSENDRSTDVYFVQQGRVGIKSFAENGHEVAYHELREGECFGEFSAIDGLARSATLEALEDVVVARLSAQQFHHLVMSKPEFGWALAQHLVSKLRRMSARILEFSTQPVAIRIRLELLRLARTYSRDDENVLIRPAPTHQVIASLVSTHREAVSRELGFLVKEEVIRTGRQSIEIIDLAKLRQLAQTNQRD